MSFRTTVVSLTLAGMAWLNPAGAQPLDIDVRIRHANEARRAGQDLQALNEFNAIWDQVHSPQVEAQIGLAEEALGRWVAAAQHLDESMAAQGDPWITRNRAALDQARGALSTHLGTLQVTDGVPAAEVWVDGSRIASLPMSAPMIVASGTSMLEVRAPGYVSIARVISVPVGGLTRESVSMVPDAPATQASGMPPSRALVESPAVLAATPVHASSGSALRVLAWVTAGAAVVGAAVGTVGLVQQRGYASDVNSLPASARTPCSNNVACSTGRDSANSSATVAWAGYGAAVALASGAVVLFLVAPGSHPREQRVNVGVGVGPGSLGATGTFTF